jgi:xyloglucan-specific endo-beta-1,4-glucanase
MRFLGLTAPFVALAAAVPRFGPNAVSETSHLVAKSQDDSTCDQNTGLALERYSASNRVDDNASSGSQCIAVNRSSGKDVSWSTNWSWGDASYSIKGFPSLSLKGVSAKPLSEHKAIPATWTWRRNGKGLEANVAYTLIGAANVGGPNSACSSVPSWVVNVWIGTTGEVAPCNAVGVLYKIASVNGKGFDVYQGVEDGVSVWTFVAHQEQTEYIGDLLVFADWLAENEDWDTERCLLSINGGVEIYGGSDGTIDTESFSVEQVLA